MQNGRSPLHDTALARFRKDPVKAYQRHIREVVEELEPRAPIASLDGCTVREITARAARAVILKYEWLGTMGRTHSAFGLFSAEGELIGVACFGLSTGIQASDMCGVENRKKAIALERGACVHYAPPNAASFLISRACELMTEKGFRVFYAYADVEAGEMGTVYQACNWLYIGKGVGRNGRMRENWIRPDGSEVTSRTLRHNGLRKADALALGWRPVPRNAKHKFLLILGDKWERRALRKALRYPVLPYPKRQS